MAQRNRKGEPGSSLHVSNRTLRHRPLFEGIDNNPATADIVQHRCDHEFGSAQQYLPYDRTAWLERSRIEGMVTARLTPAATGSAA